ncbi:hypothetical protein Tco_0204358 [Tanacetum coccineum]
MLLMQAQENGAVLDEEQLLFLAGEQVTNFDDDVDDPTEKDLALNVDHIFEADQCDAFDSDVDEAPNIQTMFMVNLSSEDPIYDEVGPSYDSNTPFEVQDHDTCVDHLDEYHEVHEMQNDVQHNFVVDSDAEYASDSNIILYNQYMEDNKEHVVQRVQKALFKEVKGMEEIFDQMSAEVDQNTVDKQCAEIERKNLLIAKCLESLYFVKQKFLRLEMYSQLMFKPIPHPLKNNRSPHLNYINHLKESVETVREIVEEARVAKPLDNALYYACQYTKLSQELLEYVIGTCPKSFNERDYKAPSTPVTRKKQVTFNDKPGTSSSNTQKHEVHQKFQHTNVPVIHSTGVNTSTEASGSKPRSNTKKNRILPAKSENEKKVEDHLRTNNYVNATPTVKIVLNKGKQIWKPKGKLSDNSLNKTKRVWKATSKLIADIGYQWRPTGKKFALGKLNCGYQWRPTGKKFALSELCPLTKLSMKCCSKHMMRNRSKLKNFVEKFIGTIRFGNGHFGAIMGYADYVIGDSVISRVYYVEGLGHNLFSVGQFCDFDLAIACQKHSCFVR